MVQKFYAIKDESSIKTGTIISTIFAMIVAVEVIFSVDLAVCSRIRSTWRQMALTLLSQPCYPAAIRADRLSRDLSVVCFDVNIIFARYCVQLYVDD